MSRGIGKLQRKILEIVERNHGQISAVDTAWLFLPPGEVVLRRSTRESVHRAAARLVEMGRLSAAKRKVGGYDSLFYFIPDGVILEYADNPPERRSEDLKDQPHKNQSHKYLDEYNSVNKSFLIKRGWTRATIKRFLGEPDSRIVMLNRHRNRPECRYDIRRVIRAEDESGFRFRLRNPPEGRIRPLRIVGNRQFQWEGSQIVPNELTKKEIQRLIENGLI